MAVEDDIGEMLEMLRLVVPEGVINVSVMAPLSQWTTVDWQVPDPERWRQRRRYGAEFGSAMCHAVPDLHGVGVIATDPVTLTQDVTYFFSRSEETLEAMAAELQRHRVRFLRYLPDGAWRRRAGQVSSVAPPARPKRVGLQRHTYAEERTITSVNHRRVDFIEVESDFTSLPPEVIAALEASPAMRANSICPVPDPQIDCYHFFNAIPLNDVPFITTFETSLPRWMGTDLDTWRFGVEILASRNCRRLFALSGAAFDFLRKSLHRFGPDLVTRVMTKVDILYPPQPYEADADYTSKFSRTPLEFVFVGRDFLQKGGYEMMLAFEQLMTLGVDMHVHVVTSLAPPKNLEPAPWNIEADRRLARCIGIFEKFPRSLFHRAELTNSEVLALFAHAHVGLLPSFRETFGYVVLEAQSRGCPMITTRQRAFPEINNALTGWLIDLPDGYEAMFEPGRREVFEEVSSSLTRDLMATLTTIVAEGNEALIARAERARARISRFHNPEEIANRIYSFY